jgi:5S rRNA maturation endonuclease (ribonuclease M5)
MFDAKRFCQDFNIIIPDSTKNTQEGWVNIRCPFPDCTDRSNHGGFCVAGEYYYCWKCGWHSLFSVVQEITQMKNSAVHEIIKTYSKPIIQKKKKFTPASIMKLPEEACELKSIHKKFIKKRNFDVEYLKNEWGVMGTDYIGDYAYRILIPIIYRNQIVSYQTRDITGEQSLKYKACKMKNEIIHHKHIVYGMDKIINQTGIIVEGITDVWRIGAGALATFGTGFTIQQIHFLYSHLKKVYILYDFEEEAQRRAQKLAWELSPFIPTEIITLPGKVGDPDSSLSSKEVKYLRKQIF